MNAARTVTCFVYKLSNMSHYHKHINKTHSQKGNCTAPNLAKHLSPLEFVSSFSFASKDGVVPQCKQSTNFSLPNAYHQPVLAIYCFGIFPWEKYIQWFLFPEKQELDRRESDNLRLKGKRQLKRFDLSSLTRVFQVEGCQSNPFYVAVKCWR